MKTPARWKTGARVATHLLVVAATALVVFTPAHAATEHRVAAFFIDYAPDPIDINTGDSITFVNSDPVAGEGHSFTQAVYPREVTPKFDTGVIKTGTSAEVTGISALPPGEYLIQCTVHAAMRGHLFVHPPGRPPTEALMQVIGSLLS